MITPEQVRNWTWEEVQTAVTGTRQRVFAALKAGGPQTTSQLAAATGINLLTVRPRMTELYDLGVVRLAGREPNGTQGIYEAVPEHEARAAHDARHQVAQATQTNP